MTPEEGKQQYKRAVQKYNKASSLKKSSETKLNSCAEAKRHMETKRDGLEQDVRRLWERVGDLEDVISLLNGDVEEQITRTNEVARAAGENYRVAIWCNDISQASIETAYREKSITVDTNSRSALEDCKSEKGRTEEEIARIEVEMKKLGQKIGLLSKDIETAQTAIATYKNEMEKWENEKWVYYKYRNV